MPVVDACYTRQSTKFPHEVTWDSLNESWIQVPTLAFSTPESLCSISPAQSNSSLDRRKRSASERSSQSSPKDVVQSQRAQSGSLNACGSSPSTGQDAESGLLYSANNVASHDLCDTESKNNSAQKVHSHDAAPRTRVDTQSHDQVASADPSSNLLAADYNRLAIKKSLLKVYHDSLEGALSCWLTERNCPYISTQFNGQEVWASSWSNRIVTRICHLDKSYMAVQRVRDSEAEQATQAMNLAMMAFASQWAQNGTRSTQRLSDTHSNRTRGQTLNATEHRRVQDGHFGRSVQVELWHKACAAVQKATTAGNTSFKVIFACIILSIAQRPISEIEDDLDDQAHGGQAVGLEKLRDLLNSDGAPLFLDIALRLLHDHRRQMHDAKKRASRSMAPGSDPATPSAQDKQTFDLLFWLAVMFDSLSAAMNRRAFVVNNEDSTAAQAATTVDKAAMANELLNLDLDGWDNTTSSPSSNTFKPEADLWGRYFLDDRSSAGQLRMSNVRWPCSYENAAAALCDAAPVKVLLYRRVAQLQELLYRPSRTSAQAVEEAIEAALEVYHYWNATYGLFIQDCTSNHEDLSARIQSWYILLAGHWHLAVFLLADAIDEVDTTNLSGSLEAEHRDQNSSTLKLRTKSARAVSELGRNSRFTTGTDSSFSQSPDFHFAVNKAALLTEPWTVVLVRSFGRAGEFFAKQLLDWAGRLDETEIREAGMRLHYCVDALWLLGKKSDMALVAARLLAESVEGVAHI